VSFLDRYWEDHLMRDSSTSWENATHDWAAIVDHEHLAQIREQPTTYAPGGMEQLILEVLAMQPTGPRPQVGLAAGS
jgi:hypothetical protein